MDAAKYQTAINRIDTQTKPTDFILFLEGVYFFQDCLFQDCFTIYFKKQNQNNEIYNNSGHIWLSYKQF